VPSDLQKKKPIRAKEPRKAGGGNILLLALRDRSLSSVPVWENTSLSRYPAKEPTKKGGYLSPPTAGASEGVSCGNKSGRGSRTVREVNGSKFQIAH